MEGDVGEEVAGGFEAVEGVVDVEGEPCEGNSVRLEGGREGARRGIPGEAIPEVRVLDDVDEIVEIEELVFPDLEVDRGGKGDEE